MTDWWSLSHFWWKLPQQNILIVCPCKPCYLLWIPAVKAFLLSAGFMWQFSRGEKSTYTYLTFFYLFVCCNTCKENMGLKKENLWLNSQSYNELLPDRMISVLVWLQVNKIISTVWSEVHIFHEKIFASALSYGRKL